MDSILTLSDWIDAVKIGCSLSRQPYDQEEEFGKRYIQRQHDRHFEKSSLSE
jgi:hypothetical protein